ncbi:hypothetical protein P9112_011850 [Eukaryota sp. TZLM1-RC]
MTVAQPLSEDDIPLQTFPPPQEFPYPILLCHGVARFDFVLSKFIDNRSSTFSDKFHYFRGLRTFLISKGYTVFHSCVPWSAGVDKRAEVLYENILSIVERTGSPKVNLICHSMAGLDARHMLFNHRHDNIIHTVAGIVTISTPHLGSPFAGFILNNFKGVLSMVGKRIDVDACQDLTVEACMEFANNPEVIDFESKILPKYVQIRSFAGVSDYKSTMSAIKPSHKYIFDREGPNDGLVSVQSAIWKSEFYQGEIPNCDHLNEICHFSLDHLLSGEVQSKFLNRMYNFYLDLATSFPLRQYDDNYSLLNDVLSNSDEVSEFEQFI